MTYSKPAPFSAKFTRRSLVQKWWTVSNKHPSIATSRHRQTSYSVKRELVVYRYYVLRIWSSHALSTIVEWITGNDQQISQICPNGLRALHFEPNKLNHLPLSDFPHWICLVWCLVWVSSPCYCYHCELTPKLSSLLCWMSMSPSARCLFLAWYPHDHSTHGPVHSKWRWSIHQPWEKWRFSP